MASLSFERFDEIPQPPVAEKIPRTQAVHGDVRVDEYGWLRDKTSPATNAYLQGENAYADAVMASTAQLQEQLYREMLGRIRQTDVNVPYRKGGSFYYTRTVEGRQYPIYARRKGSLEADEEVILDVNALAEGKEYMSVSAFQVSDDGNYLAYSTDDTGYRQYRLHVKDLRSGSEFNNIADRTGAVEWARDGRTIFYSVENDAKRQCRVYRHAVGTNAHELVFEEPDELFDVWVDRSRSGEWLFLVSESKISNEVLLVPAGAPESQPVVMVPRRPDHKYYPDHRGDSFYITTNDVGINYRVVTVPVDAWQEENWKELIPHRPPVRLETVDIFRDHMVILAREEGLGHLEIYDLRAGREFHRILFPEPAYAVAGNANPEFDTTTFRYTYESFITPPTVYDYDTVTREQTLMKRTEVLGGYDPADYSVERFFVPASDGARIPVALVHRKDRPARSDNPLLLHAYGSYGISMPDGFYCNRFSLVDRGVTFAIAHVRGGAEMGKEWHEQGRMMVKKNTFTDFIAVAEYLVENRYTSREKLAAQGASAGGLLMGAVANMRPDLFGSILAYVPFVDVINTMLDSTLPLTTQEYVEWGNPNEPDAYFYMKSYDPYSNVERKGYPAMLVRTSLNDSQVGYWEAAKWVAKLRAYKTDDNILILRVNMEAGHGGASGRYDKLREEAHDYAWLLTQFEVEGVQPTND